MCLRTSPLEERFFLYAKDLWKMMKSFCLLRYLMNVGKLCHKIKVSDYDVYEYTSRYLPLENKRLCSIVLSYFVAMLKPMTRFNC